MTPQGPRAQSSVLQSYSAYASHLSFLYLSIIPKRLHAVISPEGRRADLCCRNALNSRAVDACSTESNNLCGVIFPPFLSFSEVEPNCLLVLVWLCSFNMGITRITHTSVAQHALKRLKTAALGGNKKAPRTGVQGQSEICSFTVLIIIQSL